MTTRQPALALALLCFLLPSAARSQMPALMPLPSHLTAATGTLSVDHSVTLKFEGFHDPLLDRAGDRFLAQLSRRTGVLPLPAAGGTAALTIRTGGPSAPVEKLGEDESYKLSVTTSGILLTAPTPLGVLHGFQTLLQLVETTPGGFVLPAVEIDDAPRFPWRGLMIDCSRHFITLDVLRQNLDLMEAAKLNVFHWHLSDDQGFRVQSKTFPLLTGRGSDGLFYTQAEVRDLVAYARDRGIRVIPEFDMPGHATAWFVGYPDLASSTDPAHAKYEIIRKWGVFDAAMDPTRESTFAFLDKFLAEMIPLFPDAYFHIGGDECNGAEWKANPRIVSYMQVHGMKSTEALQAYFTTRIQALVTKHGKISIGWDEVLQPSTPKDVVIQSWRGQESLAQAARGGNRGILSAGYYLDLNQPASAHYAVDPLGKAAASLTPEEQSRILGGEAAMWSEYMVPEILTGRVWPRAAAVAERLWSPQSTTDTASMYQRLAVFNDDLSFYGLPASYAARPNFQRLVSGGDAASLQVMADVLEPTKGYDRGGIRNYTQQTPLNRLIDVLPAESDRARDFHLLAAKIADGTGTPQDLAEARRWLTLWRDNAQTLDPHLPGSALTAELTPASDGLSQTAALGLAALDSLEKHSPVENKAAVLEQLKDLGKPKGITLDQIVPSVELLVQAAQ